MSNHRWKIFCVTHQCSWLKTAFKSRKLAVDLLSKASAFKKAAELSLENKLHLGCDFHWHSGGEFGDDFGPFLDPQSSYDLVFCSIEWFKEHGDCELALQTEDGVNHSPKKLKKGE
jgi:hypothetical protein